MRWILMLALVLPCALVSCNATGSSKAEAELETVSLTITGMT